MGKLEIVIGPMYAGKTTRLIEIYNRYKICNISTIVVNHSSDKRYGLSDLHSHQKVKIPCIECSDNLSKLYETHDATVKNAKVIKIQIDKKLKFTLLYNKSSSLEKKIKIEQTRKETKSN